MAPCNEFKSKWWSYYGVFDGMVWWFEHRKSRNCPQWRLFEWRNLEYESGKNRYCSTSKCMNVITAWKVSVFGGFLVCIFPVFGLNTERYVSLRSQSECEKNTDQKNSDYGHFSRFVCWYRKDNILFVLFVYTL